MKKFWKKIILIVLLGVLFLVVKESIFAQTATPTATPTLVPTIATSSATATPTKITSLPKTGFVQFTGIVFAASIGIIAVALLF